MALNFPRKEQTSPSKADGLALKCKGCEEILIKKALDENIGVCPHCSFHHQIPVRARVAMLLDEGSFEERHTNLLSVDILDFKGKTGYMEKLEETWRKTGSPSALVCGMGAIEKRPVSLAVSDCFWLQGSMGSVLGEKYVRAVEEAIEAGVPFISVSGTGGGARMQEGLFSLLQMAKTSAALGRLREAGLPFISVVTMYTMAGVWASWASLGDVIIAEPGAMVGFTGPRVIKETIRQELPEGFQSSEFLIEHGQVDMITPRHGLKECVARVLEGLLGPVKKLAQ